MRSLRGVMRTAVAGASTTMSSFGVTQSKCEHPSEVEEDLAAQVGMARRQHFEGVRAETEQLGVGQRSDARRAWLPVEERDLAEHAAAFIAAGVDVIVWSMQGAIDVARIGPLAEALRDVA